MLQPPYPSRWLPAAPDRIQLYSLATPNGKKIGIALEELELPYEAHRIDILSGDQSDPEFLKISPHGKIPAMIDPDGPGGKAMALAESGAMLLYLAEKADKLLPREASLKWETVQWIMFQMASIGPMFGQFGHFYKFAKDKTSDEYALGRYASEAKRLLGVLNTRLEGRSYLVGDDFTVADIANVPWIEALDFYEAKSYLELESYQNVVQWVSRCSTRPGYQRGVRVCA